MRLLNREICPGGDRGVKVLQFGEGNFLRGFVDYMIDVANEKEVFDGNIVIVKAIAFGSLDDFRKQECRYSVCLRGMVDGAETEELRIVGSVAEAVDSYGEYTLYMGYAEHPELRFVVSNTTEAGIVLDGEDDGKGLPPRSFPGKLTRFLYERYRFFGGDLSKGLIMLPVELIEDNGSRLRDCVLELSSRWGLEEEYRDWLREACLFCNTLVDRIVTGYPGEEELRLWGKLGCEDRLMVAGEPYALWVIEAGEQVRDEFPLDRAGLPVLYTDNLKPYRERKVRILNGAHTAFAALSFLAGNDTVLESMRDTEVRRFIGDMLADEVMPTLELPPEELAPFAKEVLARFENPFIRHSLLGITLNSVSKWRTRCLPAVLEYDRRFHKIPRHLAFSLAALAAFYRGGEWIGGEFYGSRKKGSYRILESDEVLDFFTEYGRCPAEELSRRFLSRIDFWGQDLTELTGMEQMAGSILSDLERLDVRAVLRKYSDKERQE